ncbi:MAG TPA: TRAP transporter fused permease subunit [Alphaproteobacteria bacterium]|nr:TRAP transporter fused permease subunit [Alphaproteobacteria bacterium]
MSVAEVLFSTGLQRELSPRMEAAVKPVGVAITLGVIYSTVIATPDLFAMTTIFLSAVLALCFLTITPTAKEAPRIHPIDWALSAASVAVGIFFATHTKELIERIALFDDLSSQELIFGSILLVLLVEISRRATGLGLTVLVLLFFAYNLWGHVLPGAMGHGYISYEHFLDLIAFTTDGIFGGPLRVAATYAFLFVLFGAVLNKAKGGEFFFDIASAMTGRAVGGPAKIAVVSSGLYGTISGNPVADVVTTGAVTVPVMKRLGYPAALAGGIEVAASTGGSLAPPVMGSAAFIMAEYTSIPYADIAIAATIPAFLYYLGVYAQVHLYAAKHQLRGLDMETLPKVIPTLMHGWVFIVPLLVLIGFIVAGYSANLTAIGATVAVFVMTLFNKKTRLGLVAVYDVLAEAALRMVPVAGACAAAGLIVGALSMTGLSVKFVDVITLLTGDSLFLTLVVTALLTLLLGLGLPTSSSYILAAVLIAPVLTKLGLSVMAAHMFILYYAVLSAVTPPVAVAGYAAAAIAQANPLTISILACRMSIVAFIAPFSFAYGESLLFIGEWYEVIGTLISASIGVILLAVALEGYWRAPLNWPLRVAAGLLGLGFLAPAAVMAAF